MYSLLPAFTPTFKMGPFHFNCDLNSTCQTDQQTPSVQISEGGPATNLISYLTNTHARTHVCKHEQTNASTSPPSAYSYFME